jgi:hypothetical protein
MLKPDHQTTPARPPRRVDPLLGMPYRSSKFTDVRYTWALARDVIRAAKTAATSAGGKP